MKVKVKENRSCACFGGRHKVKAGQVVSVVLATNQPDYKKEGKLWVDEPDCPEHCYGILLYKEDYTKFKGGDMCEQR